MSAVSLFNASNKLEMSIKRSLNGVLLVAMAVVFSEVVPNSEQAKLMGFILANSAGSPKGIDPEILAASQIYHPDAVVDVTFKVLSADREELESVNSVFGAGVSGDEQLEALTKMGEMIASLAEATPENNLL